MFGAVKYGAYYAQTMEVLLLILNKHFGGVCIQFKTLTAVVRFRDAWVRTTLCLPCSMEEVQLIHWATCTCTRTHSNSPSLVSEWLPWVAHTGSKGTSIDKAFLCSLGKLHPKTTSTRALRFRMTRFTSCQPGWGACVFRLFYAAQNPPKYNEKVNYSAPYELL